MQLKYDILFQLNTVQGNATRMLDEDTLSTYSRAIASKFVDHGDKSLHIDALYQSSTYRSVLQAEPKIRCDYPGTYRCCSDKAKTGRTYDMKTSQYEIYLKMLGEVLEWQNIVGEILLAENARFCESTSNPQPLATLAIFCRKKGREKDNDDPKRLKLY